MTKWSRRCLTLNTAPRKRHCCAHARIPDVSRIFQGFRRRDRGEEPPAVSSEWETETLRWFAPADSCSDTPSPTLKSSKAQDQRTFEGHGLARLSRLLSLSVAPEKSTTAHGGGLLLPSVRCPKNRRTCFSDTTKLGTTAGGACAAAFSAVDRRSVLPPPCIRDDDGTVAAADAGLGASPRAMLC